jgi:hypothetical protein
MRISLGKEGRRPMAFAKVFDFARRLAIIVA